MRELGQFASHLRNGNIGFCRACPHSYIGRRAQDRQASFLGQGLGRGVGPVYAGFIVWWQHENAPARLLAEAYTHFAHL